MNKLEKEYLIKSYECDKNNHLRLLTLLNIFQDMAGTHAYKMGVGIDFCIEHKLAWVGSNYHIKINSLPQMHQKVMVVSWPAVENKLTAIREFQVVNKLGEILVNASSQWVLISAEKKRPVFLRDNLPEYTIVPERVLQTDFPKMKEIERTDYEAEFTVRFDDIDLNNHVNNAVYILWATEAVKPEFRMSHIPSELEVTFKKECLWGEEVAIKTQMEDKKSMHSIVSKKDGRELCRIDITWQKL